MSLQITPSPEFVCQRCGACCRWEGDVCLTQSDIAAASSFLQLDEVTFINTYCHLQRNRQGLSLLEREDGACCMLSEENRCLIQDAKPQQCRDFPTRWKFEGWETRCPAASQKGGKAC